MEPTTTRPCTPARPCAPAALASEPPPNRPPSAPALAPPERRLFLRERADGLYRVYTYLAAKLIEEIALALIITLVFSAYVFYGVRLQGEWVVFW